MNYRHAFHAGNFADVLKHVVLTRILLHLHEKPAPFRVIDTHAGAGLYDLAGEEARRGSEWQDGIGRLVTATLPSAAAALLQPYLDIVTAFNATAGCAGSMPLLAYPGSPLITRALLRPDDRLVACEIEVEARRRLIDCLRRDKQARVVDIDGWMALPAYLPLPERRGLVLIDPPFEQKDEFAQMARGFAAGFAKWPTGIYLLWYPVKDLVASRRFVGTVAETVGRAHGKTAVERLLRIEISRGGPTSGGGLQTAGLLAVNPPWRLAEELATLAPALSDVLGADRSAGLLIDRPSA